MARRAGRQENEVSVKQVQRYSVYGKRNDPENGIMVLHTDYAAVEKLCQQQHEALLAYRQRDDCHCPTCRQADAALTAYAALFPKTGGAK